MKFRVGDKVRNTQASCDYHHWWGNGLRKPDGVVTKLGHVDDSVFVLWVGVHRSLEEKVSELELIDNGLDVMLKLIDD